MTLSDIDAILARLASFAHADADISGDGVVGIGPGKTVAKNGDSLTGL